MNFWNDYEGKTLDEKYPLAKLLYPEGRSGFFTTSNGTGTPAVVKLTESLNDEKDALEQWETIQRLNHPNLLAIRSYGQTLIDDTPLVFAVLEPSEFSLADILKERPMTGDETRQIASSVLSALKGLHAAGLFHGHIEPRSVLAVGEVVKLRSDCVRKLPGGNDGERLKALEIQDFSVLLLEALTQQRHQQKAPLPAPFERVVRNGIAGTWGVKEISEALEAEAPAAVAPISTHAELATSDAAEDILLNKSPDTYPVERKSEPDRATNFPAQSAEPWPSRLSPLVLVGIAAVLVIVGIFYFLHRRSGNPAAATFAPQPVSSVQPAPSSAPVEAPPPATPQPAAAPSVAAAEPSEASPPSGKQIWRVVAYTYNSEEAAHHKVSTIEERHTDLKPEVFTPSGHAPYLVALGGPMSHDEAVALKRKARAEGLPHDTYTQNYSK
jgi:eukaryotic-like serine/threonine-protein kinase